MDKMIDDLVKGCTLYLSKRTKFLHWDGPYAKKHETIPLYENFCYCLALMRQKGKEGFFQAKQLLERLLYFQVEGLFPKYLHDYPQCYPNKNLMEWWLVFEKIEQVGGLYLGEALHRRFQEAKMALKSRLESIDPPPENLFYQLLSTDSFESLIPSWSPFQYTFQEGAPQYQEEFRPKPSLIDYTLCYYHGLPPPGPMTPESLKMALVSPKFLVSPPSNFKINLYKEGVFSAEPKPRSDKPIFVTGAPLPKQPAGSLFWKEENLIHTLAIFAKKMDFHKMSDKIEFTFFLEPLPEPIEDQKEVTFYLNRSANPQFFDSGKRVSSFRLDRPLKIQAAGLDLILSFEPVSEEAQFYGHVALSNRPNQLIEDGEAYDWSISLRTVRRSKPAKIVLSVALSPTRQNF